MHGKKLTMADYAAPTFIALCNRNSPSQKRSDVLNNTEITAIGRKNRAQINQFPENMKVCNFRML